MEKKKTCFITGFPRSGTTLVEKLIGNQPNTFIAHQLFPTLLLNIKKHFLLQCGIDRSYPFIPYPTEEEKHTFFKFLTTTHFTEQQVSNWLLEGINYPAMGEKQVLQNLPPLTGSLIEIIQQLLSSISNNTPVIGFKDVLMDEYIPYFEQQTLSIIYVTRDPRAIIASLINSTEMGEYRPTLYNLQLWKRGLHNAKTSKALILKYEDVVTNTAASLQQISKQLQHPFRSPTFPLKNNDGSAWKGNSSFKTINALSLESINRFEKELSKETILYIESICSQEMEVLGYKKRYAPTNFTSLAEPFKITHRQFTHWNNSLELQNEWERRC